VNEIKDFLMLFSDKEFVSDLDKAMVDGRIRLLAKSLKSKTTNVHINKALDVIVKFPTKLLDKISKDYSYISALKYVSPE
jgi:hypothetical protein